MTPHDPESSGEWLVEFILSERSESKDLLALQKTVGRVPLFFCMYLVSQRGEPAVFVLKYLCFLSL
jgi:hypothetical protein